MERNHVHFAARVPGGGERGAISGIRWNAEFLIFLDVEKFLKHGNKLYRSSNGVLLTRGTDGLIAPVYLERIVERRGWKTLWPEGAASPKGARQAQNGAHRAQKGPQQAPACCQAQRGG